MRAVCRETCELGVTLAEYRDVIRGTTPPWAVQQALFAVIAPLGRLLGYRPDVPYPGVSGAVRTRSCGSGPRVLTPPRYGARGSVLGHS